MEISEIFGSRLRMLRDAKGELQPQLGSIIGVKKGQVSEMENGNRMTTGEKIALLALHFGVTADYLLGLSDDPKKSKAHKPGTNPETIFGENNGKTGAK